jgi:hypothetical protein
MWNKKNSTMAITYTNYIHKEGKLVQTIRIQITPLGQSWVLSMLYTVQKDEKRIPMRSHYS